MTDPAFCVFPGGKGVASFSVVPSPLSSVQAYPPNVSALFVPDFQLPLHTSFHPSAVLLLHPLFVFSHKDSHNNPANLKSNIFDQALKDAEGKKPETAIELYAQAEQYLNNEGIFYPIYYEKRYYAIAPGLTGIIVHPYDMGIDFMHATKT